MAKEIVLILEEVKKTEPGKVDSFKEDFMKFYNEPPAVNIAIIRAWLMEAFTRGIFTLQISDLKILNNVSTPLDVRQNYLLQGKLDRRTFFRNKKFELDSIRAQTHKIHQTRAATRQMEARKFRASLS
jgi:hypothetical protein